MSNWLKYFILTGSQILLTGCVSFLSQGEPPQVNPNKKYAPEELKEDLAYLFQTLEDVHPDLYAYTSENEIATYRKTALESLSKSMTSLDFWKVVTPVITRLGDGHTFLRFPSEIYRTYADDNGTLFPFEVLIDKYRLFVQTNYTSDSSIAVNDEIVSINGIPSKEIIQEMQAYTSGERISFKNIIIRKKFKSLLWALYGFSGDFNIGYISSHDTRIHNKTFSGITDKELNALTGGYGSKQNDAPYSYYSLPEEKIGIIDFRSFRNLRQFKKFLNTTFTKVKDEGIQHLIIDLRKNGGGNSRLGDALFDYINDQPYTQAERMEIKTSKIMKKYLKKRYLKWYLYPLLPIAYLHPQGRAIFAKKEGTISVFEGYTHKPGNNNLRFQGKTYLLIGPNTFSSANMFAIAFKCYKMGTVIGEETGGVTIAFGDVILFTSPHTKLRCGVSHKKFVHPCGEEDGHGVIPDYEVKQSPADFEKGIDTVMEFTKELIRNKTFMEIGKLKVSSFKFQGN